MKKGKSPIFALAMCGLFVASGAVQLAVAMDKSVGSSTSPSSASGMSDVKKHPSAKFGATWSDQLIRERDEAKKSKEQAEKERDQAKKERDEAQQAQASASKGGSIQAKSANENGNQETKQLVKERDQYLKERDALQQETSNIRQERDRAMSAISGGSALDAVDSGMPVEQRK